MLTEKDLLEWVRTPGSDFDTQSPAWKQFVGMMLGPRYATVGPIHYLDAWLFFKEGWKNGMFWAGYGGEDS